MDRREHVCRLIEPAIADIGYSLVRAQMTGQKALRLQVMVERKDLGALTVDECASVSRTISAVLDDADLIPTAYTLEVSSPGIDRPLVRLEDFERFKGNVATVLLFHPMDGRRRFTGRVLGLDEREIRMRVDQVEICLPFDLIARAKLVVDDELLSAS